MGKPQQDTEIGGQGGRGGKGETGGQGGIVLVVQSLGVTSHASAPGGAGGPGGEGGAGGQGFPRKPSNRGPKGPEGPKGDEGPHGDARMEVIAQATFPKRLAAAAGDDANAWFRHLLKVADYHYRRDGDASRRSRTALGVITTLAIDQGIRNEADSLLRMIVLGNTPSGMSRDRDVTPDVEFASKDNQALLNSINATLAAAGQQVVQWSGAQNTRDLIEARIVELQNSVAALKAKRDLADEDVVIAEERRALANEHVSAIKKDIADRQQAAKGSQASLFGQMAALTGIAVSVASGAGAVVAVGQGLVALEGTISTTDTLIDVVKGVMDRAEKGDKQAKDLVKGFDDIADTGKKLLGIGAVLEDLGVIEHQAPAELAGQIASLGRELALVMREVGISDMEARRARTARDVADLELAACLSSIAFMQSLSAKITEGQVLIEEFVRGFLVTARSIGDRLGDRFFVTMRAREIYLGLDSMETPPYDFAWADPDHETLLEHDPNPLLVETTSSVTSKMLKVIDWSGIYAEMFLVPNDFSFSPTDIPFTSNDASVLARVREASNEQTALEFEIDMDHVDGDTYELRFDTASVVLTGARLKDAAGHPLRLQHTGICSLRRRPRNGTALDDVKAMMLRPHVVDIGCAATEPATVRGGMPPVIKPDSLPPFSVWGRPVVGRWKLWIPDTTAAWDLSGLQSVAVTFHANALLRGTGGGIGGIHLGIVDTTRPTPVRRLVAQRIRIPTRRLAG